MTKEETEAVKTKLKSIKPGVNYPTLVEIEETTDAGPIKLRLLLQSYFVGMYCALYINQEQLPRQCGDHDNRKFVRGLKRDIENAINRGASVVIESIQPIKTEM